MSRPPGVVVSMLSVSERRPTLRRSRSAHGLDQVRKRPAETVELPDDQHVALPNVGQRIGKASTLGFRSRGLIAKDRLAACLLQGIELQRGVLVACRNAGISNGGHDTA